MHIRTFLLVIAWPLASWGNTYDFDYRTVGDLDARPANVFDDGTYQQLRTVLTYTNTDLVEAACLHVPVPRSAIGTDGLIADPTIRGVIAQALDALTARVEARRTAADPPA